MGGGGTVETAKKGVSTTTFAFRARDASRGRDAPINRRRDVAHAYTHILSLSVLHFLSVFLLLFISPRLPSARLRCVREGGIIEIARRRVQQTRKGGLEGTRAPLATDQ